VKRGREALPLALFELSVMRETVRQFGPGVSRHTSARLLSSLALLESKALQLIELDNDACRENGRELGEGH
jgi:hypothetical protein